MHFSVPSAVEVVDGDKKYHLFHIHINGVFHCLCRYSQLYQLQASLRREFGSHKVPPFPPKRFFSLTPLQLLERKDQLQRFLQSVSTEPALYQHPIFTNFLANAQKESTKVDATKETDLDVFLMNGNKVTIRVLAVDKTNTILEKFSKSVSLEEDYIFYFGLFLMRKEEEGDISIVRQLQDIESVFISLTEANKSGAHRIVLRKAVLDPTLEVNLMSSKVAVNLLYLQALTDLDRGWIEVKDNAKSRQLASLRWNSSKVEFLKLCQTQRFYGYIHLRLCSSDWPKPDTPVRIGLGAGELVLRVEDPSYTDLEATDNELVISVTRIRAWSVVSPVPRSGADTSHYRPSSSSSGLDYRGGAGEVLYQMKFEYLEDGLSGMHRWVKVVSEREDQVLLLNMSLRTMVNELIMRKEGRHITKPGQASHSSTQSFLPSSISPGNTGRTSLLSDRISLSSLGLRRTSGPTTSALQDPPNLCAGAVGGEGATPGAIGDEDL